MLPLLLANLNAYVRPSRIDQPTTRLERYYVRGGFLDNVEKQTEHTLSVRVFVSQIPSVWRCNLRFAHQRIPTPTHPTPLQMSFPFGVAI